MRVIAIAMAFVFAIAGCGSNSGDEPSTRTTRSSPKVAVKYGPIPTAADLDALIIGVLSKNVDDDERLALIEDGEAFRPNIPDLFKAVSENPKGTFKVVDPVLDNHDGTITATFRLDKDGTGRNIQTALVHFVWLDNRWKIARNDMCALMQRANYQSQACG
jgi:hypothetical protein